MAFPKMVGLKVMPVTLSFCNQLLQFASVHFLPVNKVQPNTLAEIGYSFYVFNWHKLFFKSGAEC